MNSNKELKDLLKLLRSQGVLKYKTSDLELELSEVLQPKERRSNEPELEDEMDITDEQLQQWSALKPADMITNEGD